jgi:hypothetical protein
MNEVSEKLTTIIKGSDDSISMLQEILKCKSININELVRVIEWSIELNKLLLMTLMAINKDDTKP